MKARAALLALTGAIALELAACSANTNRGGALYEEGRYVEAAEVFERTEYRLEEGSERARAEYGLYRGLTFLELGDLNRARQWLGYASQIERHKPGVLSDGERARLDRAWSEVEARSDRAPSQTGGVMAATEPGRDQPALQNDPNGRRSIPSATRSFVAQ